MARCWNSSLKTPRPRAGCGARLHPRIAASLAAAVRVMNCSYSNLIESHNTRPSDIERALANDLYADETRRNLQLEARAHIRLQEVMDAKAVARTLADPVSLDFLLRLHREFYRDAPDAMLLIEGAGRRFRMVPGTLRNDPLHDVAVGRHVPSGSDSVWRFMAHFAERYSQSGLSSSRRLLAIPAAHHRFNYTHPFPDGNGRVSRLMSHAMAHHAGSGAHGLWSVSRGLARGIAGRSEYRSMMYHPRLSHAG